MARDIQINFSADVDQVIAGGKDIREELDDVNDKLGDVADTSRRSGQRTADALGDVEDAAGDVGEAIEDAGDSSTDALGNVREGARDTTTAMGEIGSAAKDVLAGDIPSAATSAVSGISALIPGIGGFIGAGIASVAAGLFSMWDDQAKKTEQRIADMYANLLESGQNYQTQEQILQGTSDLFGDPQKLAEVEDAAKRLGLAVSDVGIAFVTAGPQRDAAMARLNELLAENAKLAEESTNPRYLQYLSNQRVAINQLVDRFEGLNSSQEDATYAAQLNRRAQEDVLATYSEQGAVIDGVTDSIERMPAGKTVKLDVDTTAIDRELSRTRRIPVELVTRNGKAVAW